MSPYLQTTDEKFGVSLMLRDYRLAWELIPRNRRPSEQLPMQQLLSEVLKAQVGNWATSSGGELTYFHVMPPRVVAKVRSYATPPQLRAAFQQRFRGRYKDFKLLVETEDDFGEGFRALYDEMTTDGFREWQTQSEFLGA